MPKFFDKVKEETARATSNATAFVKGGNDGLEAHKGRTEGEPTPEAKKASEQASKVSTETLRVFNQAKNFVDGGIAKAKSEHKNSNETPPKSESSSPRPSNS